VEADVSATLTSRDSGIGNVGSVNRLYGVLLKIVDGDEVLEVVIDKAVFFCFWMRAAIERVMMRIMKNAIKALVSFNFASSSLNIV